MQTQITRFAALGLAACLNACGGGGGGGGTPTQDAATSTAPTQTAAAAPTTNPSTHRITGSVGDGPIIDSDVVVYDKDGLEIIRTTSSSLATYQVELTNNNDYPLTVVARGGTDLVTLRPPDFELSSKIESKTQAIANVSPITTIITNNKGCEGETADTRWQNTKSSLLLGIDELQIGNPIKQEVSNETAAAFVYANEAVAEWIRRTAEMTSNSHEAVIAVLACDLVDGKIDVENPQVNESQARIGLAAIIVEGLLRLEVLAGNLKVNGTSATVAMDTALLSIKPDTSFRTVSDVPLASDALSHLSNSISAIQAIQPVQGLASLQSAIDRHSNADIRNFALTTEYQSWTNSLQDILQQVSMADQATLTSFVLPEKPQPTINYDGTSNPENTQENGSPVGTANINDDQTGSIVTEPDISTETSLDNADANGGDSNEASENSPVDVRDTGSSAVEGALLQGTVAFGMVSNSDIAVYDRLGERIATTESNSDGSFTVPVAEAANFPLTISAASGFNHVTGRTQSLTLTGHIANPGQNWIQISGFSTLAENIAQCVSDYSAARWDRSWGWGKKIIALGLRTEALLEPVWSKLPNSVLSDHVLVDQAFTELIRRTANAFEGIESRSAVTNAIGCELVDGRFNKNLPSGLSNQEDRILSVVRAFETQIRLELISQSLTSLGQDTYAAIDEVLLRNQPQVPLNPAKEKRVRFTALEDLMQPLRYVDDFDATLRSFTNRLSSVSNGNWAQVSSLYDDSTKQALDRTAALLAGSSDKSISEDNAGSNNGTVSSDIVESNSNSNDSSDEGSDSNNNSNNSGSTQDSTPAPIIDLSISSNTIDRGESVTLNWRAQNADSCTAAGGWSGSKTLTGTQAVNNVLASSTFTLTCNGSGGQASTSISVEVLRTVEVSWVPPTENVDGTVVQGLSEFRIYYGNRSRSYDNFVTVNGSVVSYSLRLPDGQYYIAVTAIDLEGDESEYSNEVAR